MTTQANKSTNNTRTLRLMLSVTQQLIQLKKISSAIRAAKTRALDTQAGPVTLLSASFATLGSVMDFF